MEIINNVKDYRKYLPEYQNWSAQQDLEQAKRIEYLKQNPDKINQSDIARGKILLNAIDVMDEYSQSYAEDMEVATEFAKGQIQMLTMLIGIGAGTLLAFVPAVQKAITKIAGKGKLANVIGQLLPSAVGMAAGFAASFPVAIWATKAQVSASRKGRFEAMRKDLSNPAAFAVLTEEQNKKVNEEAKNIVLEDKEKKRLAKQKSMGANPLESIKTLKKYYSENQEYKTQKAEFDAQIKESEKQFDRQLSENEILKAKKDQQILAQMVRKIDLASQDYAENTELATNTLTVLSLAGGGLVGWVSNKLIKISKVNAGGAVGKIIPWVVGATIPLLMSIYSAKVQKQASRIGRHKAKQEMLNSPESLVYVDKKDSDKMTNVKQPTVQKKPNIFKFIVQLYKDNKEYNEYRKTKALEDLKRNKAIDKLELTEEQLKDAKALQMNVFKTFNKVDEKSQAYSESVEAVGEIAKEGVSSAGSLLASGFSTWAILKMLEKTPSEEKKSFWNFFPKAMTKTLIPLGLVLIPIILIDVMTTKAQKKASRVADMLALKEMEDYRHYAGYNDTDTKAQTAAK